MQEILQWRKARVGRLQAPDGWLSLVGLCWLEEGENNMGADPVSDVPLKAPGIPSKAAIIKLKNGVITLIPEPGSKISVNGKPVEAPTQLKSDADPGGQDIVKVGRIMTYVIKRGPQFAMRIKDPLAPTRIHFKGIEYFPVDPKFRTHATLESYPEPREVVISTAVGIDQHLLCPGLLHFTLKGQKLTLQPWIDTAGQKDLFIVFRDTTSGKESYGAGRFLSAQLAEDGTTTLDFNRAFSPPCAFTAYATCPLAPPENELPIAVRAGERLVHKGGS